MILHTHLMKAVDNFMFTFSTPDVVYNVKCTQKCFTPHMCAIYFRENIYIYDKLVKPVNCKKASLYPDKQWTACFYFSEQIIVRNLLHQHKSFREAWTFLCLIYILCCIISLCTCSIEFTISTHIFSQWYAQRLFILDLRWIRGCSSNMWIPIELHWIA